MIGNIIDRLLYRYDSSNYITKNRARFVLYLIITILIISPLLMFYFSYIHFYNVAYDYKIILSIIIPTTIAFLLSIVMLLFLIRGHFSIAGNMLLIIWQAALWCIIFSAEEELIVRIDTVLLIASTLTMMPIIIVRIKKLFIIYTLANIAILFTFMFLLKNELNFSEPAFTDFLSVNTIVFILIGIISYTIFSINSRALEKAEIEIAERKKAEEQRNRLQMQLLQSQKLESVGLLAGGVAHDFNNMLAAVQGFAELAIDSIDTGRPAKDEINQIISTSKKARDLTQQLLAFARSQPMDMKKIDINKIIASFTDMLSRTLHGNILIQNNLCSDPGTVEGDPVQIEQVLLNLTLNSQDSMPGGGTIFIETSRVQIDQEFVKRYEDIDPGQYILLSVSDSGSGIDHNIIDNIFDPFFTTKDFGKGTGLGLSTVYGIVKQHRGMINVYSEKNEGTVFKVYLPVTDMDTDDDAPPAVKPEKKKGNETILAVEDNIEVRNLLETVLNKNGYNTFISENAASALNFASSFDGIIHLLITDVIMPDMNGMELCSKLSEMRPGIKAIYISGYTASIISGIGKPDEEKHFIQKPFSISDFTRKVRDVLDS